MSDELPEWVKEGVVFRVKLNLEDELWHVRGIVDDLAICRRWNQVGQRWVYEVHNKCFFEVWAPHITIRSSRAG